ncbi:UPF0149 family protein [Microbulbifer hydrolyticus]|uniref:UPF0149 family protein n=1 Tax=Microbulbifer hydrolyticus TaxID=48074 RepID=A0A6P1T8J4_9GAMM|nr:UPF0149 family protein [Microbulbifer hydrolyticus]MBB5211182.1 hypothetical protein [Microbulbifer hydrolyticus]QHQ38045.1 UPF0149 family protein [Microbulbifer hydrolyticus]
MSAVQVSFDALANHIVAAGGKIGPSELHGFICGLLAAGARPDQARWKKEVAEFLDLDALPADLTRDSLALVERSKQDLSDKSFIFQPLLSSSDELAERGQTLCLWCEGFLHGFGIGKYSGELLPTSSEALKDFAEIAQLDAASLENGAEQERELFEVQEYVRMAALNIFVECNPPSSHGENDKPAGPTLH